MPPSRPLFDIDPGWLFVIAGLSLCVVGVLIPAQRDLHHLRSQHHVLEQRVGLGNERLRAHARFLVDLEEADAALTRRLAASQLNLAPMGDSVVVIASSDNAALTEWIDARISTPIAAPKPLPETTLSRLATGPQRLWLLGGGALAVFVGLMLGPSRRTDAPLSSTTLEHKESPVMLRALDMESAETADSVEMDFINCDDDDCTYEIVTRSEFARIDHRCAAD